MTPENNLQNRPNRQDALMSLLSQILANLNYRSIKDIIENRKIPYVLQTVRRRIFGYTQEDLRMAGRPVEYQGCLIGHVKDYPLSTITPIFSGYLRDEGDLYSRAYETAQRHRIEPGRKSLLFCGPTSTYSDGKPNNGLEIAGQDTSDNIDDHKGGMLFADGEVMIFMPGEKDEMRLRYPGSIMIGTSLAFEVTEDTYDEEAMATAQIITYVQAYWQSHTMHGGFLCITPSGGITYRLFSDYGGYFRPDENITSRVYAMLHVCEPGTKVVALEEASPSFPWMHHGDTGYEDRVPVYFVGN